VQFKQIVTMHCNLNTQTNRSLVTA